MMISLQIGNSYGHLVITGLAGCGKSMFMRYSDALPIRYGYGNIRYLLSFDSSTRLHRNIS